VCAHRRPAVALLLVLAACTSTPDVESGLPRGTVVIEAGGGAVEVDVEIAERTEDKSRGLMGRESLPEDAGMVFLQDQPVRVSFTMRGTLIPLSLAVWDGSERIGAIVDMEPCRSEPCPSYDPGVEWTVALEVNQGFFEDHGVEVGDAVRLER